MRVGIVGSGTMGEVHAAAWRATEAELVGVFAANTNQSKGLAEKFGCQVLGSYAELLKLVDIVDICVPTYLHKEMVLEAARSQKQVICEKPIALSIADGREMIDACNKAGVRLFVAMVVRFFPQYRLARELVAKGQIGNLGVLRLKRVAYVPQKPLDNWYADESRSGGMLVDLMIHDFDYARWLAGPVERVYARSSRTLYPELPGDYAQAILRFKSGAMALVEGGWVYPPGVFRTAIDLSGTDGLIEWNSDEPAPVRTLMASKDGSASSVGLPTSGLSEDPYTTEIRHAYDCIVTGKPFDVAAEDGLEALRISLAARESLSTGKPVNL